MWTATRVFQDLVHEGRWKVEFFSGSTAPLPKSKYKLVRLGEIVKESRTTIDPQAEPNCLFNYLGLEHIQPHTGELLNFQPKHGKEIRSRSKVFVKGNVLYARLRPYLNKVYLTEGKVAEGICSGEFYVLTCDPSSMLPRVLRALLASSYVLDHVTKFQSGAALPRVPIKDLLSLRIPLPPIEHQQLIDEFLLAADQRRRSLIHELQDLERTTITKLTESLEKGVPISV